MFCFQIQGFYIFFFKGSGVGLISKKLFISSELALLEIDEPILFGVIDVSLFFRSLFFILKNKYSYYCFYSFRFLTFNYAVREDPTLSLYDY